MKPLPEAFPEPFPKPLPKPFPWRAAIGFGLGVLRLPPAQFWAMTPRELAFAIEAVRGPVLESIGRAALNELMSRFPDASS